MYIPRYIPRIYQTHKLNPGELFFLDAKASHHITQVLRLKKGDPLVIFNGSDGEFSATLDSYTKREAVVRIEKLFIREVESPLRIHLAQAICRNDKMDYIIQKAVELGVNTISPVSTKRSEIKLATDDRIDKRLQRWKDIVISACEQSGRNQIPDINPLTPLSSWISSQTISDTSELRFILTPHAHHEKSTLSAYSEPISSVSILIGPESGFDPQEVEQALRMGFQPLQLGPRILRTETAALAAISTLQLKWGDFI
jgi:16S rRNA (uracil1498-N3)-methyltransferase